MRNIPARRGVRPALLPALPPALLPVALAAALCAGPAQAIVTADGTPYTPAEAFDASGLGLLTTQHGGSSSSCSSSLLAGGRYLLTAAHCLGSTGSITGFSVSFQGGALATAGPDFWVATGWNGTLGTGADLALVKLTSPVVGVAGYQWMTTPITTATDVLLTGHGNGGNGTTGAQPGTGAWRLGANTYEANWYLGPLGGTVYGDTYIWDFDDGTGAFNTLGPGSSAGLGAGEANLAGGDSGGGSFVWTGSQWLLAGVHSFNGLITGSGVSNNTAFGSIGGDTGVASHHAWITSITAVPEPETYALMLAGLGVVGFMARRRIAGATGT